MKKLLLSTLLLSFFITSSFGQCEVYLKKQGEKPYDWIDKYDRLEKIYSKKKEQITLLKGYFYQNNIPKTCISFDSLKLLQNDLNKIFSATPNPDKLVNELKVAIIGIIKANPNGIIAEKKSDSAINTAIPPIETTQNNSEIDNIDKITKLEKDKNLWFWISIVSFLGLISLLILYIFDRKRLVEQIAIKDDIFNKSQKESFDSEDTAIKTWRNKYANLQKEKESLEKEFSDFKNSLSTINKEKEVVIHQNVAKIATQEVTPKQFYLSIPTPTDDGLGIFRDMRQTQASPTSSYYRFELERDETKAKFWFLDNPNTIQSAVIYPETYINPVCDYEGFNSNAKKIVTKQPGIAIKEGDIWKVCIKAKIRFE